MLGSESHLLRTCIRKSKKGPFVAYAEASRLRVYVPPALALRLQSGQIDRCPRSGEVSTSPLPRGFRAPYFRWILIH
jgi:hypothetical protein